MKRVITFFAIVLMSLLVGCGASEDKSTRVVINDNDKSHGNKLLESYTILTKSTIIDFDREVFSLTDYKDLNEYITNYKNSLICSSGSIEFSVNQDQYGCGDYNMTVNHCVINGEQANGKFQKWTVADSTYSPDMCIDKKRYVHEDYSFNNQYFGSDEVLTYKKGFTKEYSNSDRREYVLESNGTFEVNAKAYLVEGFKVSINSISEEFEVYDGNYTDDDLLFQFTDLGEPVNMNYIDFSVSREGYFTFIYNSEYYYIHMDREEKVTILKDTETISDYYNFYDIYEIEYQ
ncbi:MAG: hypothetical protein U9O86_07025 [Campylobacterota bacterium]|nr:hypothetical protein [Campylobacterota bacterium]